MKDYLIATFKFNNAANLKLLNKISELPDKAESIKLFSHLINSQFKWMARIAQEPNAGQMSWWEPVYEFKQLEDKWTESLKPWIEYIKARPGEELSKEIEFIGYDGGTWAASPLDIALQLNYIPSIIVLKYKPSSGNRDWHLIL